MRFTWLTYRVAIRRSFKREYQAFCDHNAAFRGPDPWIKQLQHTNNLRRRRTRERGKS